MTLSRVQTALFAPFVVVPMFLAGCTQVNIDSDWADDADRSDSFSRVLVVGVSPNASARCDFEYAMVSQLRVYAEAKPSCALMKTSEPLTSEAIEQAAAEYQADAVLATSLVQFAAGAEEGGQNDTRGGAMYKATDIGYSNFYYGGYGAYGVPVVYGEFETLPVVTTIEGEVTIKSMLYATADASLVYELVTSANDLHSRSDALATITTPIANRLSADGLLN